MSYGIDLVNMVKNAELQDLLKENNILFGRIHVLKNDLDYYKKECAIRGERIDELTRRLERVQNA